MCEKIYVCISISVYVRLRTVTHRASLCTEAIASERVVSMSLDSDIVGGLGVTRDGSQFVFLHDFFQTYFATNSGDTGAGAAGARPPEREFRCLCRTGATFATHGPDCSFRLNPTLRPLGLLGGFSPPSVDWLLRNLLKIEEPHAAVDSAVFAAIHQPLAVVLQLSSQHVGSILAKSSHS